MRALQARYGLTYVVIAHVLSLLKYLADRIGAMYLGRLVELGPSGDVYSAPRHPYTAGLIESIPLPDPSPRVPKHQEGSEASCLHRSTHRRAADSGLDARWPRSGAR
jgi:ABC-type oligopeptide transport system ATPase subunit